MNTLRTHKPRSSRNGNVLIGCLIALGIAIILLIVSVVFVMNSWRGWVSGGIKQGLTAVLDETQIEQIEKDEINAHIETLMTRFVDKDITTEDLFLITAEIFEGPLLPMGIVEASYESYFADSELDDEAKADAKVQLGRLAYGIYAEDISIDDLETILTPIEAPAGTNNGAVHVSFNNREFNLKNPDETSVEELLEVIANAKASADEAGVDEMPPVIDLSDEVGKAIAAALGEDPELWVPGAGDDDAAEDVEPDAGSDDGP